MLHEDDLRHDSRCGRGATRGCSGHQMSQDPDSGTVAGARTQLGPYRIEERLGQGGMGDVFRATDTRLHRTVAVKVLRGRGFADPDARQRF